MATAVRSAVAPRRHGRTPAGDLSDAALDLAVRRGIDSTSAATALIERAAHDRALMEAAHTLHVQRMAHGPSDDFDRSRALRIIEIALRRLPREG